MSRYGVCHYQPEVGACIAEPPHQSGSIEDEADLLDGSGVSKHLVGLLAASGTQASTPSVPVLLDADTHFLASLSPDVGPVTWEEIRRFTNKDKSLHLFSTFV